VTLYDDYKQVPRSLEARTVRSTPRCLRTNGPARPARTILYPCSIRAAASLVRAPSWFKVLVVRSGVTRMRGLHTVKWWIQDLRLRYFCFLWKKIQCVRIHRREEVCDEHRICALSLHIQNNYSRYTIRIHRREQICDKHRIPRTTGASILDRPLHTWLCPLSPDEEGPSGLLARRPAWTVWTSAEH
jgi:hypothetical protein